MYEEVRQQQPKISHENKLNLINILIVKDSGNLFGNKNDFNASNKRFFQHKVILEKAKEKFSEASK